MKKPKVIRIPEPKVRRKSRIPVFLFFGIFFALVILLPAAASGVREIMGMGLLVFIMVMAIIDIGSGEYRTTDF